MPMDFNAVKDRARKLIHDDAKMDSHIIKERQRDRNNPKYFEGQPNDAYSNVTSLAGGSSQNAITESYVDDSEDRLGAAMDSRMKNFMENRQMPQMQVQQQQQQNQDQKQDQQQQEQQLLAEEQKKQQEEQQRLAQEKPAHR